MDEKAVLEKLVKIAVNQQKIIRRLAQLTDDNVAYLQRAAQVAAVNSGIKELTIPKDVAVTLGQDGIYSVNATVPAGTQQDAITTFIRQFKSQIASQKPDLANRVKITANPANTPPPATDRVGPIP